MTEYHSGLTTPTYYTNPATGFVVCDIKGRICAGGTISSAMVRNPGMSSYLGPDGVFERMKPQDVADLNELGVYCAHETKDRADFERDQSPDTAARNEYALHYHQHPEDLGRHNPQL